MQAEGTERSLLEASAAVALGDVLPPPAVELLAANQPQTGAHKIVVNEAELPRLGRERRRRRREGVRRRQIGADSQRLADEKPRVLAGGG